MTLRETFSNAVRPKPRRTRTVKVPQNYGSPPNHFPFNFHIPPRQRGQELPPSFTVSSMTGDPDDGAGYAEAAEVSYTITAVWESNYGSDRALWVLPHFSAEDGRVTSVTS